jgi:hypothetical protein
MSNRRPVHPRTLAQIAVVIAVVVALGAAISWVRHTAPETTLPPVAEADPGAHAPELVTCERTLPDAPHTARAIAEVEPVGLVHSSEVMECPAAFDGHVVVYIGEVVGDVLRRSGGAWMLVNDDAYALQVGPLRGHNQFHGSNSGLSVWLPDPLPELEPGRPNRRGTIIQIRGVIHRSDPADGGGLTLRAVSPDATEIIAEAVHIERPLHWPQMALAAVLAAIAIALFVAERRAVRQR